MQPPRSLYDLGIALTNNGKAHEGGPPAGGPPESSPPGDPRLMQFLLWFALLGGGGSGVANLIALWGTPGRVAVVEERLETVESKVDALLEAQGIDPKSIEKEKGRGR